MVHQPQNTPLTSDSIDSTKPSIARAYDAVLGGKDNYKVDREVRGQLLAVAPELGTLAWDNRGFLVRVTRFLAGNAGITQFLDCGSGLPTVENTHQVAQRMNPEATVVYVDFDPVVLAYGRALLAENDHTSVVQADFRYPDKLLGHPEVAVRLEMEQPLALYHIGTLHHLGDDERPRELTAAYIDALPSGSYFVLSHFYHPGDENAELADLAERLEGAFLGSPMGSGRFRSYDEIAEYFDGLELVEPGLVPLVDWWPDGPSLEPMDPVRKLMVGAVGRKP